MTPTTRTPPDVIGPDAQMVGYRRISEEYKKRWGVPHDIPVWRDEVGEAAGRETFCGESVPFPPPRSVDGYGLSSREPCKLCRKARHAAGMSGMKPGERLCPLHGPYPRHAGCRHCHVESEPRP